MPSLKCTRCGRALKDPKSIEIGMGPTCAKKARRQLEMFSQDGEFSDKQLPNPLSEGVILRRVREDDQERVYTNVPHLVTHHSPTGFNFGYGGSGPSDLSLNILEAFLHRMKWDGEQQKAWDGHMMFNLSWQLHHDFKREFVAGAEDETVIPAQTITGWIEEHLPLPEKCSDCGNLTSFTWYGTPLCHTCAAKPEYQDE